MIKVNGHTMSIGSITSVVLLIVWLAGLSFKVDSHADELQDVEETQLKIARIEVKVAQTEKDVDEIKMEQKEQGKLLIKIWEEVKKDAQ